MLDEEVVLQEPIIGNKYFEADEPDAHPEVESDGSGPDYIYL